MYLTNNGSKLLKYSNSELIFGSGIFLHFLQNSYLTFRCMCFIDLEFENQRDILKRNILYNLHYHMITSNLRLVMSYLS